MTSLQKLLLLVVCFQLSQIVSAQSFKVSAGSDFSICFGAVTSLRADLSGGIAPYFFRWKSESDLIETEERSVSIAPQTDTEYLLEVTDAQGRKANCKVSVSVTERPKITMQTSYSIEQGEVVSLSASIENESGEYKYLWRPSTGLSNISKKETSVKPLSSVAYTLMVKDARGCSSMEQVVIHVKKSVVMND